MHINKYGTLKKYVMHMYVRGGKGTAHNCKSWDSICLGSNNHLFSKRARRFANMSNIPLTMVAIEKHPFFLATPFITFPDYILESTFSC